MKDGLFLIVVATICAGIAWGLWHVLGQDAYTAILVLALVAVVADNIRLRRHLADKK
jgi:hypothetical protein